MPMRLFGRASQLSSHAPLTFKLGLGFSHQHKITTPPRNCQRYYPPILRPTERSEIENEVSDWLDQNNLWDT
jgi:hypothetical protein